MTGGRFPGWPLLVVLLDGLADWPCRELDGATPLEAAPTPNLDRIAAGGATGLCYPLGPGRAPSSERAQWRYLGYDDDVFPGRAALEAAGAGVPVAAGDVCSNLALRTAEADAGHLRLVGSYGRDDDPDAPELLQALDGAVGDFSFSVRYVQRAEGLLTVSGPSVSPDVSDADPFSAGQHVHRVEPLDEAWDPLGAMRTAAALNTFLLRAHRVLEEHPLNRRRRAAGISPLNAVVTKWTGRLREVTPLPAQVGGPATVVASAGLYTGLARVTGAQVRQVPAHPDAATELASKVEQGLDAVAGGAAFVYIHSKAPDEAGHRHDPAAKAEVIAACDRGLAGLVDLADCVVAITADHGTPSWGPVLHSGDAVPLAVRGPTVRVDAVERFDERVVAAGGLGTIRGNDLLPLLVDAAGRARFTGCRHGRRLSIAAPTDTALLQLDSDEPDESA